MVPDCPVTDIRVVNPELPENAEVRVGVGVGVGNGVIIGVGSVVGTSEITGWVVVREVTGLPDGTGSVVHPVARMKKMREILTSRGIFIL
jgi:hypothetical protein